MIKYATRLPPGKPVELLDNGLIRKTNTLRPIGWVDFMEALVNHLIKHPDPLVVPVYSFERLSHDSYSYDMMRCGILSQGERALINEVGDLADKFGTEACKQLDEMLYYGLVEFPELFDFLTKVTEQGRYWDLHSGNVALNEDANYCLIDCEGFVRTPLELYKNDWITR